MTFKEILCRKYRDGGTYQIDVDEETYCIDFRINTDTPGVIYDGYPSEGSIVTDRKIIQSVFHVLFFAGTEFGKEGHDRRHYNDEGDK